MIAVEISGPAVPGLSRRDLTDFIRRVIRSVSRADAAPFQPTEVSVALVRDVTMKKLNLRYRRKNSTTDILTFGADPAEADQARPLGELVISLDQARRQARQQKHSLATEIRYLLVHGVLHSFGYDHETDGGEMNELELRIRDSVGLS